MIVAMSGFRDFARFCLVSFLAAGASAGCATAFTGGAHVPGGAAGCSKVCGSYGMDLAGMVAMGEYSDGCICKVRGQTAAGSSAELAVAGAGPAAVAIVLQTRASEREAYRGTTIH
jgi:hypothetical protein